MTIQALSHVQFLDDSVKALRDNSKVLVNIISQLQAADVNGQQLHTLFDYLSHVVRRETMKVVPDSLLRLACIKKLRIALLELNNVFAETPAEKEKVQVKICELLAKHLFNIPFQLVEDNENNWVDNGRGFYVNVNYPNLRRCKTTKKTFLFEHVWEVKDSDFTMEILKTTDAIEVSSFPFNVFQYPMRYKRYVRVLHNGFQYVPRTTSFRDYCGMLDYKVTHYPQGKIVAKNDRNPGNAMNIAEVSRLYNIFLEVIAPHYKNHIEELNLATLTSSNITLGVTNIQRDGLMHYFLENSTYEYIFLLKKHGLKARITPSLKIVSAYCPRTYNYSTAADHIYMEVTQFPLASIQHVDMFGKEISLKKANAITKFTRILAGVTDDGENLETGIRLSVQGEALFKIAFNVAE